MDISEQTSYRWNKKKAVLGTTEHRRLRQHAEEIRKLKQMVADLRLDMAMFQQVITIKL